MFPCSAVYSSIATPQHQTPQKGVSWKTNGTTATPTSACRVSLGRRDRGRDHDLWMGDLDPGVVAAAVWIHLRVRVVALLCPAVFLTDIRCMTHPCMTHPLTRCSLFERLPSSCTLTSLVTSCLRTLEAGARADDLTANSGTGRAR